MDLSPRRRRPGLTMASQVFLAFSTFPDADTARKIVRELVEARLVACGNIVPQIESIYHWQGKLESSAETLAIFKLSSEHYADFESKLQSLHPYDVPEIVCLNISKGLPDYLRWVTESCGP
jgi:periplasmic divalent cation tolerance protein